MHSRFSVLRWLADAYFTRGDGGGGEATVGEAGVTGPPENFSARSPINGNLTCFPIIAPPIPTNQEMTAIMLSRKSANSSNRKKTVPKCAACTIWAQKESIRAKTILITVIPPNRSNDWSA